MLTVSELALLDVKLVQFLQVLEHKSRSDPEVPFECCRVLEAYSGPTDKGTLIRTRQGQTWMKLWQERECFYTWEFSRPLPPLQARSLLKAFDAMAHFVLQGKTSSQLAEIRKHCTDYLERRGYSERSREEMPAAPSEDGPTMEGVFYFEGKPRPFSTLQWRLLKALWIDRSVSLEAIGNEVYPGEDQIEGKLKKLVSDTNSKLLKAPLPFEITSPMAGHYRLQKLPPG